MLPLGIMHRSFRHGFPGNADQRRARLYGLKEPSVSFRAENLDFPAFVLQADSSSNEGLQSWRLFFWTRLDTRQSRKAGRAC